jgi:hypothetical protein
MRVLLERGLAFELGQDCVEDFDFGGREGDPGVLPGPAIARLDELHDGASGTGGNRGQLDQLVLSRLRSGLSTHLCGLSLKCQGAFPPEG